MHQVLMRNYRQLLDLRGIIFCCRLFFQMDQRYLQLLNQGLSYFHNIHPRINNLLFFDDFSADDSTKIQFPS